jgi:hypothetical protein
MLVRMSINKLLGFCILLLVLAGCAAATQPDPLQVVQEWAGASTRGDWSKVQELMDDDRWLFGGWANSFEDDRRYRGLQPDPTVHRIQQIGDTTTAIVRWEASKETVSTCYEVGVNKAGKIFGVSRAFKCLDNGDRIP